MLEKMKTYNLQTTIYALLILLFLCLPFSLAFSMENHENEIPDEINQSSDLNSSGGAPAENDRQLAENKPEESTKKKRGMEEYELPTILVRGNKDPGWKKKDIQLISRQTLTRMDLKEVPASFGDSINALTALPGIIRTSGGIFGPLVIRGADTATNNYFIDDIPINNPLHFGGLHSVINTNLMKDIDVYASAFPAEFNAATSAVINISTTDEVDEFGGYADLSLLSLSALVKTPILKNKSRGLFLDGYSDESYEEVTDEVGYIIASGRYGYIYLAAKAAELVSDEEAAFVPEYWDYQFKMRYNLNPSNSLTMLIFGHSDFIDILVDEDLWEEGDDPLFEDAQFRSDVSSHSQGIYFDSRFSNAFSNRFLIYSTMQDTHTYSNFISDGSADWAQDIGAHYKPWIAGVKNKIKIKYLSGYAELRGALEYSYYHFKAKGKTILPSGIIDVFDPADEDQFYAYNLDDKFVNHLYGGYIENEFTYRGLKVVSGIRSERLARTSQTTFDPRIMMSYRFKNDIILSAASGHYSYFFQTNPVYFNRNPDLAAMEKNVEPEKAFHLSVGGQKEYLDYTFKAELFSNYFYHKPEPYPHYEADGTFMQGLSCGKLKTKGFELMLRKDSIEGLDGTFGWISYTFTRARHKSGLPTTEGYGGVPSNPVGDEFGDQWTTSSFEQQHNVKLVGGYRFHDSIFSGRLQYYSGFPYTPYIDGIYDTNYYGLTGEDRYYPVTGERNSENFPDFVTLDFRYTHKISFSRVVLSCYVEQINVFMQKQKNTQKWYYDRPYESGSNPVITDDDTFSFLISIGIEARF